MNYGLVTRNFDHLFDHFFNHNSYPAIRREESFVPQFSFSENEKSYFLSAEVPGVKKENLKIEVKGDELKITGFRGSKESKSDASGFHLEFGEFTKLFRLGKDANLDGIEAKHEDGILFLTIPKTKELQPRYIDVK